MRKGRTMIGQKIALLMSEGKHQDQAVAQAPNMARHGALGPAAKRAAPRRRKR